MSLADAASSTTDSDVRRALCLAQGDHVANVLDPVTSGDRVSIRVSGAGEKRGLAGLAYRESADSVVPIMLSACEAIPRFHKIAMVDLAVGDIVIRDGYAIGRVITPIRRGAWVHIHNIESQRA